MTFSNSFLAIMVSTSTASALGFYLEIQFQLDSNNTPGVSEKKKYGVADN